jgi:hypothetical protein
MSKRKEILVPDGVWKDADLEQLAINFVGKPEDRDKFIADFQDWLARLAVEREERFLKRQADILDDPTLDDRHKALYLDRQIWGNERIAAELGMNVQRIDELRGGRASARRPQPHPSAFPPADAVIGWVYLGEFMLGNEAGAVRRWVEQRGSHRIFDRTGAVLVTVPWRAGRPRANRGTLSKPQIPGTHRKGYKGTKTDKPE